MATKRFRVWVTLLVPHGAEAVVGKLVAMGWGVSPLFHTQRITTVTDGFPASFLAFYVSKSGCETPEDAFRGVEKALKAVDVSYFSMVVCPESGSGSHCGLGKMSERMAQFLAKQTSKGLN